MLYTIKLSDMEFRAYHGCYDLEQRVGNKFVVDLEIVAQLGNVASADDVKLAVNYLSVYQTVEQVMQITQRTIERVATNIIERVKHDFEGVVSVRCTVAKIAPPLGGKVGRVSVTIEG